MIHLKEHVRVFTIFRIAHNPPCLPYATLLLGEERGLILPNSEKNSSKKSFL